MGIYSENDLMRIVQVWKIMHVNIKLIFSRASARKRSQVFVDSFLHPTEIFDFNVNSEVMDQFGKDFIVDEFELNKIKHQTFHIWTISYQFENLILCYGVVPITQFKSLYLWKNSVVKGRFVAKKVDSGVFRFIVRSQMKYK